MNTSDIVIFFSAFSLIYPTNVMAKGIAIRSTIILETLKSGILSSFVAMYKILTEMLKIIEEIMKVMSIDLAIVIDFDLLILSPIYFYYM